MLLFRLGQAHFFAGAPERALAWVEQSLDVAEALQLPDMLARSWSVKGAVIAARRPEEARVLIQQALEMVLAHDLPRLAGAMYANLADLDFQRDRYSDSLRGLEQLLRSRAGRATGATRCSRSRDDLRADHARTLGRG